MSTRVLPFASFFNFNTRMSDLRRRIQPPPVSVTQPGDQPSVPGQNQPVPQTRSVRRNLFGPVDHEENMKCVQAELTKIAESDSRRWNFDFHNELPLEGRFSWKSVKGADVPVAYEMPNLTARLTQLNPTPSTSSSTTVISVPKTTCIPSSSSAFTTTSTRPTSSTTNPLRSTLHTVTTASTTVFSPITKSVDVLEEDLKDSNPCPEKSTTNLVESKPVKRTVTKEPVNLFSAKQSHITDFLKVRKRQRSPTESDSKSEDAPSPPLLKRTRSST